MSERVIWERTIDNERIERRTRHFLQWFCIPAAFCLLAGLIFAGWQNAIGIAIVLGIFGGIFGSYVRFSSLSDRANPAMSIIDGSLVLGSESVPIADVDTYTTLVSSTQTSVFGDRSRIQIGKAIFRVGHKEIIEFGWPNMGEPGVESVEIALDPVLPGKWIAPEDFLDTEVTRRRGRPSRRRL